MLPASIGKKLLSWGRKHKKIDNFGFDIEVCGRFLRRGGIDINPIRSSMRSFFFKNFRVNYARIDVSKYFKFIGNTSIVTV